MNDCKVEEQRKELADDHLVVGKKIEKKNDEDYGCKGSSIWGTSPTLSDDQWEDVIEDREEGMRGLVIDNKDSDDLLIKDSSLDETVHDLEFIESTCSMIQSSAASASSIGVSSCASTIAGSTTAVNSRKSHHLSSPKSRHFFNHKRSYKRSTSSPSFLLNNHHKNGNSLFETNTFEFVLVNNEVECVSPSCCKYTEKSSLIEDRDQKARDMSCKKDKSCAPLDVVLERLDYKLKKIEKLEKKSQQEEEIKQRYVNVKKKFLRMLELGMITSQREAQNSPPDHSIDILQKAKHNKKAILYLQSPEKFSHFLSRKALKYYYKLCQIARYGTPKSEFAATRILDNLFLGDIDDAFNEPVLKQLGITHIVTCVKSLEPIYPEKGFEYLNLHLYDEEDQNISDIFQLSYEFIEKATSSGSSVLVHCMKGKSRSASVLISYLMKKKEWSFETALEFVKAKRDFVQPNSGFVSQLKQLERSLFNQSPLENSNIETSFSLGSGTLALCF